MADKNGRPKRFASVIVNLPRLKEVMAQNGIVGHKELAALIPDSKGKGVDKTPTMRTVLKGCLLYTSDAADE